MITLTPQLKEIQDYHQYDYKTGFSDWSLGLAKGKYVNGSVLDNLRNNLTCADWLILIESVDEKINLLPLKIRNDVASAKLGLIKDTANVTGEYKDWILEKKPGYQDVQRGLWKTMTSHYEALKFLA